jgi:hypothetical protein
MNRGLFRSATRSSDRHADCAWLGRKQRSPCLNDRALSKRERDRSRFPHREPIGLHRRPRVDRTPPEREGNGPAASPCLSPTDYARSPRTSRAAPQVAVFAGRPSSPERAAEYTPDDSEVESMRCYREIVSVLLQIAERRQTVSISHPNATQRYQRGYE